MASFHSFRESHEYRIRSLVRVDGAHVDKESGTRGIISFPSLCRRRSSYHPRHSEVVRIRELVEK